MGNINHSHSLISIQPLIFPLRFIKYFTLCTALYCYKTFFDKSVKSRFLYEFSQILYLSNQAKKQKHYLGWPKHACGLCSTCELPIFNLSLMTLPHGPGGFVFSCHGIGSDTDLSVLTRAQQPDFTSRPICGDCQVLFLVTCGTFHC